MKRISILVVMLMAGSLRTHAQWTPSGSNLYWSGTGNLGIGTITPGAKLSFPNLDASTSADGITWYNPGPLQYGIYKTSGTWTAPNYQQLKLSWETGIVLAPGTLYGKSYVDIQGVGLRVSSGNVGIGTATPAGKLHVIGVGYFGNENADASYRVSIGGSGSNYGSVGSGYRYGTANFQHTYAVSDYASQIRFDLGGFNFLTAPVGTVGSSVRFTNAMSILQNGNVGIGTTTPQNKLEINTSGLAGLNVFGNSSSFVGSDINISRVSTAVGVGRGATIQLNDLGSGTFSLIQNSSGGLQFFNNYNSGGWIERMRISTNGNVGIGTTDPKSFKLAVDGKVWATEVQVALTVPGPDYVFEETYELP